MRNNELLTVRVCPAVVAGTYCATKTRGHVHDIYTFTTKRADSIVALCTTLLQRSYYPDPIRNWSTIGLWS